MAKSNEIVVVANMGGTEACEKKTGCPEDGRFQLNANVVFDQNGTIIARYYKERLFYEFMMDLPREKQNPIFRTSFGKFATFTSFDAMFKKMSLAAQIEDVDAILLSALWFNFAPMYRSTQFFQGWAIGNNATLIVASLHHPNYLVTGSGIFMGKKGSIGHVLSPDGISKLIVATIPKRNRKILKPANIFAVFKNGTQKWSDDGKSIPEVCSNSRNSTPSVNDYICMNEDISNYTLVKLVKTADHLKSCNNDMCCELDYVANNINESFYLGVFNGSHKPFTRYFYWEENCFLARCEDTDGKACSTFPLLSKTLFYKVHLTANFSSRKIYPSIVADKIKLVPVKDWSFIRRLERSSIIMDNNAGIPLLAATLNGRSYEKDPPYVR